MERGKIRKIGKGGSLNTSCLAVIILIATKQLYLSHALQLNWSIDTGNKASSLTGILKDQVGTVISPTNLGITSGQGEGNSGWGSLHGFQREPDLQVFMNSIPHKGIGCILVHWGPVVPLHLKSCGAVTWNLEFLCLSNIRVTWSWHFDTCLF